MQRIRGIAAEVRARARVCACVRVCVRACVRARARARVYVWLLFYACVRARFSFFVQCSCCGAVAALHDTARL